MLFCPLPYLLCSDPYHVDSGLRKMVQNRKITIFHAKLLKVSITVCVQTNQGLFLYCIKVRKIFVWFNFPFLSFSSNIKINLALNLLVRYLFFFLAIWEVNTSLWNLNRKIVFLLSPTNPRLLWEIFIAFFSTTNLSSAFWVKP